MRRNNKSRPVRVRRIPPVSFTLADRLLAAGQHLRAGEAVVAATLALGYAAKCAQAGGAR